MTQEEKVRNAVKVADEMIGHARPEHCYAQVWQSIFSAMLYEPYLANTTATGAEFGIREAEQAPETN